MLFTIKQIKYLNETTFIKKIMQQFKKKILNVQIVYLLQNK